MRLPRLLCAAAFAAAAASLTARADDTKEFLDPANWEGRADIFKIENGTVVGETTEDPKYNTFFVSKKKYGDFEMAFKCQLRGGAGNTGVQVRSEVFDKEKYRVKGPQVDIAKNYFGSLYAEGYGMMKAAAKDKTAAAKTDGWNEYHVVVKGNRVTVKLNGETTVDEEFQSLPGKKGDEKPTPFPAEGVIAFQVHAGVPKMRVEFKDITFTDLGKK